MRLTLLVLIAAVAAALAAAPADARKRDCVPPGHFAFERTGKAVVVARESPYRIYGCLFRKGELVRLSEDYSPVYRLAGRYVAYWVSTFDAVGSYYNVFVQNLATGRLRRVVPAYDSGKGFEPGSELGVVPTIVMKRNASLAWVSCPTADRDRYRCPRRTPRQLWRVDRRGRELLDEGRSIRGRSLRRDGSTLSWVHGRERRTADLR